MHSGQNTDFEDYLKENQFIQYHSTLSKRFTEINMRKSYCQFEITSLDCSSDSDQKAVSSPHNSVTERNSINYFVSSHFSPEIERKLFHSRFISNFSELAVCCAKRLIFVKIINTFDEHYSSTVDFELMKRISWDHDAVNFTFPPP